MASCDIHDVGTTQRQAAEAALAKANIMTELTYGEFKINTDALPATSVAALLSRGFAHFMGNETASRVASHFGNDLKFTSDADKQAAKLRFQGEAIAKLESGTVGVSSPRGPRGSSIDTIIRALAEKEVRGILANNKLAMPTGDKTIELGTDPVERLTKADLIARRIAKHGDRLRKEAEAEVRRLAKVVESTGDL